MSSSITRRLACRDSRAFPKARPSSSRSLKGRRVRPRRTSAPSEGCMGHRLFVGNLSFETSDVDLKEAFSKAGACETAQIVKDRLTGRSRGFGFVEMASADDAQRAVAT